MTVTFIKQKKHDDPESYEEHLVQLKSQSLHKKLAEIEKHSSLIDLFQGVGDAMAIDLENRILLGVILSRLTETENYTLAKFEEYCLDGADMSLNDAQDCMKTSEFILASNVPIDELYQLKWAHCRILASHIRPSDLQSWIEYASYSKPKELEEYFNRYKSYDPEKFIEWIMSD